MPRKARSDKGSPREEYNSVARKSTRNLGKKYNVGKVESRGEQRKEFRVQKSFWRKFKMDEVITWDAQELENRLIKFYEEYEARNLKAHGHRWWYPEDPKNRVVDMRYRS